MHFEHLDCLVWPASVLPFPLEVLIVNDRPLNLSTRAPYIHNHDSVPSGGAKMCFGTSWGRRYRIGKRRVVAGQQILGVALRSEITSTANERSCLLSSRLKHRPPPSRPSAAGLLDGLKDELGRHLGLGHERDV